MSTQKETLNCELQNNALKQRIEYLMTPEEKEKPYSFATRVGLSKGTFTGIWVNGRNSLHQSTINKISKATGANAGWIATGEGEPFANKYNSRLQKFDTLKKSTEFLADKSLSINLQVTDSDEFNVIDKALLEESFITTDEALKETMSFMDSADKSDFILKLYKTLVDENKKELNINTENFILAVFTIETALQHTRRMMSPKNKAELISDIYEKYYSNAEMKKSALKKYNERRGDKSEYGK
ncbi:hypothetical protein [Acinetobacter piscicola]|uniref:hypothetical protein n=1 Tax=Acinetobacter piscicola TaxID=2006115 RepID=UPI001020839A|nr:hypothetical protein [Acinetobacter piscicola]RYL25172.1 hypothetical protein EWP19_13465 [Acinetobacter piscicola]